MNRLIEIGFESAGYWKLDGDELSVALIRHRSQRNILYAFVCDGEVKYVGKTTQTLSKRMGAYKKPGKSQTTNIKNHANIEAILRNGGEVDILALPDGGLMHYGQFHLNLAAGLEDSIISILDPPWNGVSKPDRTSDDLRDAEPEDKPQDCLVVTVGKTYYGKGFFNVPVAHAQSFGGDGDTIEIYCENTERPVMGLINRRANQNGSPRVMGGSELRDWFQKNLKALDEIVVDLQSPNVIRLSKK